MRSRWGTGGDKFEELFASNAASSIQAEMEILKSKPLMQRVVENMNLSTQYYGVGKIKTVNVYKRAPFFLRIAELSDSSREFSVTINVTDEGRFQINGKQGTLGYGDTISLPSGKFYLEKNLGNGVGNLYRVDWIPLHSGCESFS